MSKKSTPKFATISLLETADQLNVLESILTASRGHLFHAEVEAYYMDTVVIPAIRHQYAIDLATYEKVRKSGESANMGKLEVEKPVHEATMRRQACSNIITEKTRHISFVTSLIEELKK